MKIKQEKYIELFYRFLTTRGKLFIYTKYIDFSLLKTVIIHCFVDFATITNRKIVWASTVEGSNYWSALNHSWYKVKRRFERHKIFRYEKSKRMGRRFSSVQSTT